MKLEQEFLIRNPKCGHVLRYLQDAIGVSEVNWNDITKLNMERFGNYLTEKVSPNSARTYAAIFMAFLSRFNEEGLIPCKDPKIRIKAVLLNMWLLPTTRYGASTSLLPTTTPRVTCGTSL